MVITNLKGVARGGWGFRTKPPSADKSGRGWHERKLEKKLLGAEILMLCSHSWLGKMLNDGELSLLTFFLVNKCGEKNNGTPLIKFLATPLNLCV